MLRAFLVCLGLCLVAEPAAYAGAKLGIVALVDGAPSDVEQQIYETLESIAIEYTTMDVVRLQSALLLSKNDLRECSGEPACFVARVRDLEPTLSFLLVVALRRSEENDLLSVRLIDVASRTNIGAAGDLFPRPAPLPALLREQVELVFPRDVWSQNASMEVTTEPPGAEVTTSASTCISPCHLKRLTAGRYQVQVTRPGHQTIVENVELARGEKRALVLTMKPDDDSTLSPALWVGAGIGAVGVAVIGYLLLSSGHEGFEVCVAGDEARCR